MGISCPKDLMEMAVPSYWVGHFKRFLMILVGLMLNPGPCIPYVNCKNATHIKMDFPTVLVILRLWCIQDEKH